MKQQPLFASVFCLSLILNFINASAQTGHTLQLDDGKGHYTILGSSNPGGTFTFPSGTGTILTMSNGISPVWLVGGNSTPSSPILGTLTNNNLTIQTFGVTRATFSSAPNSSTALLTLTNTTPNTQGLLISGTKDANGSSTFSSNPGVWDLAVDGDAVVTGIFKSGGSIWFDGNNSPHSITTNKPLKIATTTNDSMIFATNNTNRMTINKNGFIGIGVDIPRAPLHVKGKIDGVSVGSINGMGIPNAINDPSNHVMIVENTSESNDNGIAIVLRNKTSASQYLGDATRCAVNNNYLTFYNGFSKDSISGRVEGLTQDNYIALYNSLANDILDFGNAFDITKWLKINMSYNPNWLPTTFNPPSITLGSYNATPGFFDITSHPVSGGCPGSPSNPPDYHSFLGLACYALEWPTFTVTFPTLNLGDLGNLPNYFSTHFQSPLTVPDWNNLVSVDLSAFSNAFIGGTNAFNGFGYTIMGIVTDPYGSALKFGQSFAFAGCTYESGSGDYAEWLERLDHSEKISIGEVVAVKGGKITKNTDGANQLMVVSWKPCVLGNMPEKGQEEFYQKVAFMGQVPVKMICAVRKGDYIIPDGHNRGFAKAISPEEITTDLLDQVLGVAWEDSPVIGMKFVKIAVGLKPLEMVGGIKKLDRDIKDVRTSIADIKAKIHSSFSTKISHRKAKNNNKLSFR